MITNEKIEKDNMKLVKNQKFNHEFKQNINRVWGFMKDVTKTYEAIKHMRTQAFFTKGNLSYEKGAEFSFVFKNFFPLFFTVHEIVDLPEYKKLHYKILCKNTNKNYEYIYHLYLVSNQKCTLLVWDWINEGEGAYLSEKEIKEIDLNRKEMVRNFEEYLENMFEDLSQHESIIVNFPVDRVWKIVSNWKIFHKLVPVLSDEIQFVGDPEEVGGILILIWNKIPEKNATCTLKIQESVCNPNERNYVFKLLCIDKSPNVTRHQLVIRLTDIEGKDTFVEFIDYFLEPVSYKILRKFSNFKTKVLKNFKYSLSKFRIEA